MYNIHDPEQSLFMVRPDRWRLIPMSYDSPLTTEYWDDDGSEEYRKMFARIEKEGVGAAEAVEGGPGFPERGAGRYFLPAQS